MLAAELEIQAFDPHAATDAAWMAVTAFRNAITAERFPDDPPKSWEQTRAELTSMPPFVDLHAWGVYPAGRAEIVASGVLVMLRTEENQHMAQFELSILPAWRRQGLGTRLLRQQAAVARAAGRRLLIGNTYGRVPAGAAFMQRIGATVGLESHINQLDLADLDRTLLAAWQAQALERAPGYQLGLWAGPYPEADLPAIVEMLKVTNTAPRGDLAMDDFLWTPEQLRQQEAALAHEGTERWTLYVRAPETGELAGFTSIFCERSEPTIAHQGFTAVWPQYRNIGLGRWLKAAMLDKILRERPAVRYIRTGNADSNAPMLKINHALGFKPYQAEQVWQVGVDRVDQYLAERPA